MNPYNLLTEHLLKPDADPNEKIRIFEAGFGDVGQVMDLYNHLIFDHYTGVEIDTEANVSFTHQNSDGIGRSGVAHHGSIYQKYLNYFEESQNGEPMNIEEFKSIFDLHFEKSVMDFVLHRIELKGKPTIGIFHNLFHKFERKEVPLQIIRWFKSISKPDSLILISIMTGDRYAYPNIDYIYSVKDKETLLNEFNGTIIKHTKEDPFEKFLIKTP